MGAQRETKAALLTKGQCWAPIYFVLTALWFLLNAGDGSKCFSYSNNVKSSSFTGFKSRTTEAKLGWVICQENTQVFLTRHLYGVCLILVV